MRIIAVCGMLEVGYESTMEHLVWRQLRGAFLFDLTLVGHNCATMEEALSKYRGYSKVFLIPPGRTKSIDFREYIPPPGDIVYIFGRPGDNLVRYVGDEDLVVSIHTPGTSDMMAISTVGIVLNEHR